MINRDELHKRLLEAFELLRSLGLIHTQSDLCEPMGMNPQNLNAAFQNRGRVLTSNKLGKLADSYPNVLNKEYMIKGIGQIRKANIRYQRPHIPLKVSAGGIGIAIGSMSESECDYYPIMANFPDYDYTISVEGDSMEPEFRDGDIIACKWLDDDIVLSPNRIYVIESDDGVVVKQVFDDGAYFTIHSLNPKYDDDRIPKSSIERISRVVGVVREFRD